MISRPWMMAGVLSILHCTFVFAQVQPLTRPANPQTLPANPQTRPANVLRGGQNLRVSQTTDPTSRPTTHPATTSNKNKVVCQPPQPRSNEPVKIDVYPNKATKTAVLEYQVVKPGQYVTFQDPAYKENWVPLPMAVAGDHFSVTLPPQLQVHRTLIRYRIVLDKKIIPEKKDIPGNFAYFCFDGIGSWNGAIEPDSPDESRAKVVVYDQKVMNSVQPLILIAKNKDVEDSTWILKDRTDKRWIGTVVYNGKVYDHVFFRNRGAGFRYALGKHQWKIFFDKDNPLPLLDDYGVPYSQPIEDLNLSACLQAPSSHGEHGMYEAATYKLFQLAGVPTPNTTWMQFRIIDAPDELGKTQFDGDLWGLYLNIENPDPQFIKQHDLPKGNLYKMDNTFAPIGGNLKTKSPTLPDDNSDLIAFTRALESNKPKGLLATILSGAARTSPVWFRENINLSEYYSYRSIIDVVQHYDLGPNRNCLYFHDPTDNRWWVIPWDESFTWNVHTNPGAAESFSMAFLDRPEFTLEYHNRLREVRDLLFNPEEISRMLDSIACFIHTPGQPSFVDVDRAMWDYNPVVTDKAKAPRGKAGTYYTRKNANSFPAMVNQMKEFSRDRAKWIDDTLLKNDNPPTTPTIAYTGPANHPKDALTFSCSAFESSDNVSFASIQWRIAKIDLDDPTLKRPDRAWEIQPLWQSAELAEFAQTFTIPGEKLKQGETYRVRSRIKDSKGVWSHWSEPVQWTAP